VATRPSYDRRGTGRGREEEEEEEQMNEDTEDEVVPRCLGRLDLEEFILCA
jgi:hypothetical protein